MLESYQLFDFLIECRLETNTILGIFGSPPTHQSRVILNELTYQLGVLINDFPHVADNWDRFSQKTIHKLAISMQAVRSVIPLQSDKDITTFRMFLNTLAKDIIDAETVVQENNLIKGPVPVRESRLIDQEVVAMATLIVDNERENNRSGQMTVNLIKHRNPDPSQDTPIYITFPPITTIDTKGL